MKRLVLFGTVVFALAEFLGAQSKNAAAISDAGAKEEILKIERERNEAIISGDATALDRLTSQRSTWHVVRVRCAPPTVAVSRS